jgi:hypothetical protein
MLEKPQPAKKAAQTNICIDKLDYLCIEKYARTSFSEIICSRPNKPKRQKRPGMHRRSE